MILLLGFVNNKVSLAYKTYKTSKMSTRRGEEDRRAEASTSRRGWARPALPHAEGVLWRGLIYLTPLISILLILLGCVVVFYGAANVKIIRAKFFTSQYRLQNSSAFRIVDIAKSRLSDFGSVESIDVLNESIGTKKLFPARNQSMLCPTQVVGFQNNSHIEFPEWRQNATNVGNRSNFGRLTILRRCGQIRFFKVPALSAFDDPISKCDFDYFCWCFAENLKAISKNRDHASFNFLVVRRNLVDENPSPLRIPYCFSAIMGSFSSHPHSDSLAVHFLDLNDESPKSANSSASSDDGNYDERPVADDCLDSYLAPVRLWFLAIGTIFFLGGFYLMWRNAGIEAGWRWLTGIPRLDKGISYVLMFIGLTFLFGAKQAGEKSQKQIRNPCSHNQDSVPQEKICRNLKIVLDSLEGVRYYRCMSKSTISTFKLFEIFPDEATARTYLEGRLWANGVKCPECKSGERISTRKDGFYRCNACKLDFTVRTGTIFERSHVPLHKWIYAMYLLVTARKGISSMQLAKEIGITQKSAWFVLHRLREACNDDTSKLSGIVEIDETFIGGLSRNMHKSKREAAITGTGGKDKTAVLGMRERGGRTLAMPIETTSKEEIQGAIHARVEVGSTLMTDEHAAYNGVDGLFFQQQRVNHSAGEYVRGMASTNGIESVWAVLKRGLNGIYHNVTVKHLGRYVDEFSFRLNAGNVKRHTLDRLASFVDAVAGKRITYKELTA
jgi:transposase-like protein